MNQHNPSKFVCFFNALPKKMRGQKIKDVIFLATSLIALSACHEQRDIYPPIETKTNHLFHDHQDITLHFKANETHISGDNLEQLTEAFIKPENCKQSVHIIMPYAAHGKNGQRLKNIKTILQQHGVRNTQLHLVKNPAMLAKNNIRLGIDIYRVTPPKCPDWSRSMGKADGSVPHTNYGCATALNFYAMITDPKVLFKGEKPDRDEAARHGVVVTDYRTGKELKLKTEKLDNGKK